MYKSEQKKFEKKLETLNMTAKEYCAILVQQYKYSHEHKLVWEVLLCNLGYIFHFGANTKCLCGYHAQDIIGNIYEWMPMILNRFDPAKGVPFHLYLQRRVWAECYRMRKNENREIYTCESDELKEETLFRLALNLDKDAKTSDYANIYLEMASSDAE